MAIEIHAEVVTEMYFLILPLGMYLLLDIQCML